MEEFISGFRKFSTSIRHELLEMTKGGGDCGVVVRVEAVFPIPGGMVLGDRPIRN